MKRFTLTLAVALCFSTAAQAYTKPQGVPTLVLSDYNLTIGVWAVHTLVGDGLGVFEYRPVSQDWSLCGQCITNPDTPNMDAAVNALTPLGYITAHKGELNSILALRYPAIGGQPTSGVDRVNQTLPGFSLAIVNGVPTLP